MVRFSSTATLPQPLPTFQKATINTTPHLQTELRRKTIISQEKIKQRKGKNHKPTIHNTSARKEKIYIFITQLHIHISTTTEKNGGLDRRDEVADRPVRSSNPAVEEEKKKHRDKAIDRRNRERKSAWWVYSFSGFDGAWWWLWLVGELRFVGVRL